MLRTFATILGDNWSWRRQIIKLARFELSKQTRGALLGPAWLIIKPGIYLTCFWFALEIGLRASRITGGDAPFILWLMSGILPWFFMARMISSGSDAFAKHRYLVQKIKFPLSCISTFYVTSVFIIQLVLQFIIFIAYFICGQPLDIHLIQIPFLLLVFFVFWNCVSLAFSHLSAYSRDFAQLMKSISTPLFWLSGAIFNVHAISNQAIRTALLFNPITFFIDAFRGAYYYRTWVWEDPLSLGCFCFVFVVTLLFCLIVYKRLHKGVPDVV